MKGTAVMSKKKKDGFYDSKLWRDLRRAVIRRAQGICEAAGCRAPGRIVDHIVARRAGGPDALGNLRLLCPMHDNQQKENERGDRRGSGFKPNAACDASGLPVDRNHPFYGGGGSNNTNPAEIRPAHRRAFTKNKG